MIEPDDWGRHVAWVHLFQWLSVPLPFAAYLARRKVEFAALNCVPIVIIGLQYVLIRRAIAQGRAPLAGLHAVCGTLLLAYVTFVPQEWRQGTSWPGDSSSDLDQSKSAAAEIVSLAGCEKTLGGRRKCEES